MRVLGSEDLMNLQGTFDLNLALWDTHGCLPDSAATLYPRPRTSARSSPGRASARGRIGSGTLGSCAMRSPEINPCAILPIAAPPRLKFQNRSPGNLGSIPARERVGVPGWSFTAETPGRRCKLLQMRGAGCASPDRD